MSEGFGEAAGAGSRTFVSVSGALAAKCSRQKLCGSFALPGNANAMANGEWRWR